MSDVTPFDFKDHPVRVIKIDGEPWFVAADVCGHLDIRVRDAMSALKPYEKRRDNIAGTLFDLMSESGVYSTIFRSRKPEAEDFKSWVTQTVLPQIRKTGSYVKPMSQLEILVAQSQALLDHDRRLAAVEIMLGQQAIESAEKIAEVAARVELVEENHDRVTAVGYANLRKIRNDVQYLNRLGRAAGRIARRDGIEVSQVSSTIWGRVNAWPIEVWDEAIDTL